MTDIKEHMEVIGADGVHIGTVDKVEGSRIKLTKKDSGEGSHKGHHHFVDRSLVAEVEGNEVRLSAIGAVCRHDGTGKVSANSGCNEKASNWGGLIDTGQYFRF